ncbi:MAG: cytochrome P450 [Gammaproteobacteria bacterium]
MSTGNVPAHVPAHLVRDVDVYGPPGWEQDFHRAWKRLHDDGAPDILWTPRHGGHWLPIRGEDIHFFFKDWEHLSTAHYSVPKKTNPFRILPIDVDPPEHTAYRAIFQAPLAPREVEGIEGFARDLVRRRIEGLRGAGRCEFIGAFANHVPVGLFLKMTDLPQADAGRILEWAEVLTHSSDPARTGAALGQIAAYMRERIGERRVRPGNDRLGRLIGARVDGRALVDQELEGMCALLLIGGLDTVGSMMGFVMHFLACHPDHRRRLAAQPALIPRAVDEFLRRFGLTIPGRVVRTGFAYKGIEFRAGDMMMLPTFMHGLDERAFADPMQVDFDRTERPIHSTFGNGPHRCPGSMLARTELRLLLEEWLARIPEFGLVPGERVGIKAGGAHGSITYLPLAWEPGA